MAVDIYTYLIVCPFVFIAGFVDAVAGGGGLISLPGYLISGLPVHYALGTNKFSSMLGTFLATYRYAKEGYIDFKRSLLLVVFAFLGSALGARLVLFIDDTLLKLFMLVILPLTAFYLWRRKPFSQNHEPHSQNKTKVLCILISFTLGIYDGFYGPGTGTFLILALTLIAHLSLKEANGTAKAINLATNVAAFVVFLSNSSVLIYLGLVAGFFSILGNYLGTRFFDYRGSKAVMPVMIAVMVIFIIKIIYDFF